jgi:two-component system, NtrC family, response regulator PilR
MSRTDGKRRADERLVLVVDDEADIRELLDLTLARMGLRADCVGSIAEARSLLSQKRYGLCLTDMRLPDGDGLELVRQIVANQVDLPVAVITAYGSAESAVAALKAGAFDYISKPVSLDQLRGLVKSALEVEDLSASIGSGLPELIGTSPAIEVVRDLIDRVAKSQAPVYITGESGTGKELAARRIHMQAVHRKGPFVAVNCGAIPENLVESEFFGYRKGAFTGAGEDRDGFFQAANGGTLFLDEVADLPLPMQVKLLRAIQEKRVRKVGATTEDPLDVRLICATHQDLRALVDQGRFRQDLFYRLNVIELRMPSLRECRDDIAMLARRLLDRLCLEAREDTRNFDLTPDSVKALTDYSFPGNVRELENILERAMALCTGSTIQAIDLGLNPNVSGETVAAERSGVLQDHLDQVEREAILAALEKAGGNRTAAARFLGITFRSMRYRMARLGLAD